MVSYTGFAEVYDKFMDNVPYDEWAEYVRELLSDYGVKEGLVCELACGTGSITERLSDFGFEMIGIDNSIEMLNVAKRKKGEKDILYLCQDMREFELFGTVEAFICICDGLNYILEKEELVQIFRLVNNYLEKGGVFIFDLNTVYKYETILGDCSISENREDMSFIWDNFYDEEERINEYELSIYVKEEGGRENSYLRFDETHYQKGYEIAEVKEALEEAGMEFVTVFDAFTKEEPKPDSDRIYVIAREKFQKGKVYR